MSDKSIHRGPNIQEDAERIWKVLDADGIVIIPADVGYAICTCGNEDQLEKIFHLKGRAAHKRHAILGSMEIHHDLHIMQPQHEEMLRTLVEVYGIPMGTIAKFKTDHPNLKALSEFTLKASTVNDTVDVLVNAGTLMTAVTNLAWKNGKAVFGSSANISTTGMKYCVEDIEQPIKDAADLVIDYGWCKFGVFGRASTMIDFESMKVVRFGACYPTIHYVFKKYFGVELPEDPGVGKLRDGHLQFPDPIVRPAHPIVKDGAAAVP